MSIEPKINVSLPAVVGKGYGTFWRYKGRTRAIKGSRRSKKSKTMALWTIVNIMQYPKANMLVVRKVYRTLKDSCFTELKWAIKQLQVGAWWDIKESPLEMTYRPTGQKIYFRGLDDPLKITSIAVEVGSLCWMWIEEAYEITSEADFDTLSESMLGDLPEGLFKQITLTFNPWNEKTWIKRRFFDVESEDILALTTTYQCNEWLSEEDKKVFEEMKIRNPRRYAVAGLGEWGIVDGLVYENWREEEFNIDELRENAELVSAFGLDYGYTNDPTALFCGLLDLNNKRLFVFDEMYQKGLSNRRIYEEIQEAGYSKEQITADSAEPKSNDELKGYGLRIKSAKKGKDSIKNGIQWVQDLEIIIHPRCVNFITEISNYTWDKDRLGNTLNVPIDDSNHLMDAMRYALEKYITNKKVKLNRSLTGGI